MWMDCSNVDFPDPFSPCSMMSGFRRSTTMGMWKLRFGKTGCARIFKNIEAVRIPKAFRRQIYYNSLLARGVIFRCKKPETPLMPTHPKGLRARILLSSVCGPYAQDDQYGSRKINPMELYHNQVTREQGPFSLRMFHRSWGILMIQRNISAPTTVLDFPTKDAFEQELLAHEYDIVGISSIIVNVGKVREMCRIVRRVSPRSTIVIGGHVTAIPGIEHMEDADHIVKGDGIAWMRRFLGEDESAPIGHPEIVSGFGARTLGLKLPQTKGSTAATIIPSVGCPMGCNFCTTSAFFGGKGKFLNFYDSGDELYRVMSEMESKLGVQSFFMMDENFLLHRRRAMELLAHMKRDAKAW